jgi:hypothetical protein
MASNCQFGLVLTLGPEERISLEVAGTNFPLVERFCRWDARVRIPFFRQKGFKPATTSHAGSRVASVRYAEHGGGCINTGGRLMAAALKWGASDILRAPQRPSLAV